MNAIRNYGALIIGLAVYGATFSWCAGVAAWMFTILTTYDWSRR